MKFYLTSTSVSNPSWKRLALLLIVSCLYLTPLRSDQTMALTLKDCILLGLENNLEVSIQKIDPLIDWALIKEAQGKFDPSLVINPHYGEDASRSLTGSVSKSRTLGLDTGIEGSIPTGTKYEFSATTAQERSTSSAFREEYDSFWGVTLTQPLLRGLGAANQLSTLRIVRKQKDISEEAFTLKLMDVITRIKTAYYQLVFALENQKVQLQGLELAAKLLQNNRTRVQIGVMAPLQVTQAEAGVAEREIDVIGATQLVKTRMNTLRALISHEFSDIRDKTIHPLDYPSDTPMDPQTRDHILANALEKRPDYRQAKLIIDQRDLQLKFRENERLPQVDLKGTYGYNGLDRNFEQSFNTKDQTWEAGLVVRIPFPDQAKQGAWEGSKLEKEKALLQLKQTEQKILVEIDNTFSEAYAHYQRIRATRSSRTYAEQALTAEMTKLKAGTTDSFRVLELQKKLTDAKSQEIQALVNYNIATAELQKAAGSTLETSEIQLEK